MKILIADDSSAMRAIITELLPETDEKIECSDGRTAIAAFAAHRPDWVLMDIEMRPVDGLAAARTIKATWPDARIVFVTAHKEERLRREAISLGASGYVLKDNLEEINDIVIGTRKGIEH